MSFSYSVTVIESCPGKAQPPSAAFLERSGYVLLVLFLLVGAVYSTLHVSKVLMSDQVEYLALSDHLQHGPGYSLDGVALTASRPPGYAFFLATLQSLGADLVAIHVVQFALLGGIVLLLHRLDDSAHRFPGPLVVLIQVALYPALFYTCDTIYPQTLGAFLFVLALVLLAKTPRSGLELAAVGLAFGALILVIPTFALTLIVVLAVSRALRLVSWREAFLVYLLASLLVGAWTLRNAVVFHRFIPVASNSGLNFLVGNCAEAKAYDGAGNIGLVPYYGEVNRLHLDEFEADRYYRNVALSWIRSHPGDAAVLYLEKVLNYFNVWNKYAQGNTSEISTWKQVVMAVSYVLLLGLLTWRLAEARRYPLASWEKLFLIVYLLSAFTMAIFITRIRHRLPYDCLIIGIVATHVGRRAGAEMPWAP